MRVKRNGPNAAMAEALGATGLLNDRTARRGNSAGSGPKAVVLGRGDRIVDDGMTGGAAHKVNGPLPRRCRKLPSRLFRMTRESIRSRARFE